MDFINNWQLILTISTSLISIGGFIYMIKDHGKRIERLESWKDNVVDDKLSSIEKKLDTSISVTEEKLKNILDKIDEICQLKTNK